MISRHLLCCLRAEHTFVHGSLCIRACILRVFPYLRQEVDVNKSDLPFSMHFDETTTTQVTEEANGSDPPLLVASSQ